MDLTACFVVHETCPFWSPVVETSEQGEQGTRYQHIVEVSHNVISILQLDVDWRHSQNQTSETTHGEHEDETDREQHWCFESHRTFPHRCDPVKDLNACWNRNQHRGIHEEQLRSHWHTCCEHVVSPNDERQNRDRGCCIHHGFVTEQWLTCKRWNDMRNDTERWQNHDVHLWMTEEPENVLIHHWITTTSCIKEGCTEMTICQSHGNRTCQHWHNSDQQVSSNQPCPAEHWHLHQGHARSAHVQDSRDDVNRAHDGRCTHDMHSENRHVHARSHLSRQRCIQSPTSGCCATRNKERTRQQQSCRWHQPE